MTKAEPQLRSGNLIATPAKRYHQGKVRKDNQDRMGRFLTPLGPLFIIADGVGGQRGGAEAARRVVEGYGRQLLSASRDSDPLEQLRAASLSVNQEVYAAGHGGNPDLAGMGSTVVFALLRGDTAIIGHVGDSRAYHVRAGTLMRVTRDHTAVQAMLDHGVITESQARNHPDANVLTRSFGHKPDIDVEYTTLSLRAGDALLLCSDGLWAYVRETDLSAVVTSGHLSPERCAGALLDLALRAGGPDNISIEYLRFSQARGPANGKPAAGKKRLTQRIASSAAVLLTVAALATWQWPKLIAHFSGTSAPSHPVGTASQRGGPEREAGTSARTRTAAPQGEHRPSAGPPREAGDGSPNQPSPAAPASDSSHLKIGLLVPDAWPNHEPPWSPALLNWHQEGDVSKISATQRVACRDQAQEDQAQILYKSGQKARVVSSALKYVLEAEEKQVEVKKMSAEEFKSLEQKCGTYDVIIIPRRGHFQGSRERPLSEHLPAIAIAMSALPWEHGEGKLWLVDLRAWCH